MSKTTGARKDRHSSKAKNAGSLTPETNEPLLIAYRASWWTPMQLVPAAAARSWMDATGAHFANRCLPLLIANQAGWFILNSHALYVTWNGSDDISGLHIEYLT